MTDYTVYGPSSVYLIGRDFHQCIHLVQAAAALLLGDSTEADSVGVLVSEELNVTPHFGAKLGDLTSLVTINPQSD